ncbi:MAG: GNAT family N-acetyltransferase [Dehalococcoidia bacterium]|nr:GNAT family N-acetyltransferase [Dehalococcoidia bacterium]
MPRPPVVRPFAAADLEAAAVLLAARHRRDRERLPILPPRYEDPAACLELVRDVSDYAEGVAAVTDASGDERLTGFLSAVRVTPSPASPSARFASPRSTMMFAHGHAVGAGCDPVEVYHALYAALAPRWLRAGLFDHIVHVPADDPAIEEAWADLGFGRSVAVGARDLRPVEGRRPPSVTVRQATPDDLEVVTRLVDEEARFHAQSPIFRPYVAADTVETVREGHVQTLQSDRHALFIASDGEDGGRPIGIISVGPGSGSPLFIPERATYIGDTAVLDGARGAGAGTALLDAALAWARERSYRHAALHFSLANALSRPFWTGHGFHPVMWHLRRHVDERIAWAQPPRA